MSSSVVDIQQIQKNPDDYFTKIYENDNASSKKYYRDFAPFITHVLNFLALDAKIMVAKAALKFDRQRSQDYLRSTDAPLARFLIGRIYNSFNLNHEQEKQEKFLEEILVEFTTEDVIVTELERNKIEMESAKDGNYIPIIISMASTLSKMIFNHAIFIPEGFYVEMEGIQLREAKDIALKISEKWTDILNKLFEKNINPPSQEELTDMLEQQAKNADIKTKAVFDSAEIDESSKKEQAVTQFFQNESAKTYDVSGVHIIQSPQDQALQKLKDYISEYFSGKGKGVQSGKIPEGLEDILSTKKLSRALNIASKKQVDPYKNAVITSFFSFLKNRRDPETQALYDNLVALRNIHYDDKIKKWNWINILDNLDRIIFNNPLVGQRLSKK